MIDLHIHTNNSDGSDSVIDVLKKAQKHELSYMSITDHESVNGHYELRNIDVKQSRQKASSIQQTILHNLAQDAWLGADNHGLCWISDVVRLTVDAVYTDGITADTFQPHVEVRLLGVSSNDVVKCPALGGDECHAPLVIPK